MLALKLYRLGAYPETVGGGRRDDYEYYEEYNGKVYTLQEAAKQRAIDRAATEDDKRQAVEEAERIASEAIREMDNEAELHAVSFLREIQDVESRAAEKQREKLQAMLAVIERRREVQRQAAARRQLDEDNAIAAILLLTF